MRVDRLVCDHAKLRSLSAELVALVSCSQPCDLQELARCRWNLARMVHLHLAFEERYLFVPLESDSRPEIRHAGASARRCVEHLHQAYTAHVAYWNVHRITAQWCEFQTAVRNIVKRMLGLIDREENDLFPFVLDLPEPDRAWQPGMRNWAGDGVAMRPLISAAVEIDPLGIVVNHRAPRV